MKTGKLRLATSALLIVVMIGSVFALPILTDDSVYAAKKANKITVKYKANGGKFAKKAKKSKKIKKGKKYGKMPKVTKTGYKLKGWYTKKIKGKKVTKNTKMKKNKKHTLYARWSANSYVVTFNVDGKNVHDSKCTFDNKYKGFPADPYKGGYEFLGWYYGNTKITSSTTLKTAKAHTLTARWEAKSYKISLKYSNGDLIRELSIKYGDSYSTISDLTSVETSSLSFTGWYKDMNCKNLILGSDKYLTEGDSVIYAGLKDMTITTEIYSLLMHSFSYIESELTGSLVASGGFLPNLYGYIEYGEPNIIYYFNNNNGTGNCYAISLKPAEFISSFPSQIEYDRMINVLDNTSDYGAYKIGSLYNLPTFEMAPPPIRISVMNDAGFKDGVVFDQYSTFIISPLDQ